MKMEFAAGVLSIFRILIMIFATAMAHITTKLLTPNVQSQPDSSHLVLVSLTAELHATGALGDLILLADAGHDLFASTARQPLKPSSTIAKRF